MADIVPFDLAGSLQAHNALMAQQRAVDTQNAFAQALPMIQSDPQNALATIGKTGNLAAYSQFSNVIQQMDDRKKAQAADRAETLGKLLYSLKATYPDPAVRKAVAQSKAADLAVHGVTPDQIAGADYSDNGIQTAIGGLQSLKDQIAQSNANRTYDAGRSDHADTVKYQNATLANTAAQRTETARHDRATENQASQTGEFGRGMTGKAYNILAQGLKDPTIVNSPEYRTAWQILSNPHVDPNTGTVVVPDLSAFTPPSGTNGAGGPQQRMPSIQSFAPPNPNQAEAASAGYANRLAEASNIIDQHQAAGTSLIKRTEAKLPGVGNYMVGSDYQQLDQAERNFVNAQLRRESGAAISESEFENARKQYLPQPGDNAAVLKQKKSSREMATRNMQLSAGNTLLPPGVIQQSSPPRNAPMVPQQQGFGQTDATAGWGNLRVTGH